MTSFKRLIRHMIGSALDWLESLLSAFGVILVVSDLDAIGHQVGDLMNMLNEASSDRRVKIVLVLYEHRRLSNEGLPELWHMMSDPTQVTFFLPFPGIVSTTNFLQPNIAHFPRLSRFSGCAGTDWDDEPFAVTNRVESGFQQLPLKEYRVLSSPNEFLGKVDASRRRTLGLVLLLFRDPSFRGAEAIRDTSPETAERVTQSLLQKGWTVVQVNKSKEACLNIDDENFFSFVPPKYSDAGFFHLFSKASWCVSAWFGPLEVARLFRVPTFMLDAPLALRELPRRTATFVSFAQYVSPSLEAADVVTRALVDNLSMRRKFELDELGVMWAPKDWIAVEMELQLFIDAGFLRDHTSCHRCDPLKKLVSGIPEPPSLTVGGLPFANVLGNSEIAEANFCCSSF